jgi:hypothetical protein
LIVAIGATVFLVRLLLRWTMIWSGRSVESRFRAAEQIVNDEQVPEEWLCPFRRRINAIRRRAGSEERVATVAGRARARCLHKLDALIGYFQSSPFVSDKGARRTLLRSLQVQRNRWLSADWVSLTEGKGVPVDE